MGSRTWSLWEMGEVLEVLTLQGAIAPLLASWERKEHQAQIRLQAYLDGIERSLGELTRRSTQLALHMDIDVEKDERLLKHYDLENYLTPVVHRLGQKYFSFVSARKRVGGGSLLTIGRAKPMIMDRALEGWGHFSCHAGSGVTSKQWKENLREQLEAQGVDILPSGVPVAVHLAWRCATPDKRNWVGLWKPTGDAMGPVLGEPYSDKLFYPNDDRIISLYLHRNVDETLGHAVDVGMWWQPIAAGG